MGAFFWLAAGLSPPAMLMPGETLEYELALAFGGTLVMMIVQVITGPIFTWLIWALAFAVVTLSYVDHVCVGWSRLLPSAQVCRVLWNAVLCAGAGGGLYLTIILLMPDVDIQNLRSILNAIQYTIRMHQGWGPLIYFGIYTQFYLCTLSFFRFLINTVLVLWALIHSSQWKKPSDSQGGHPGSVHLHNPSPPPHPSPALASSTSVHHATTASSTSVAPMGSSTSVKPLASSTSMKPLASSSSVRQAPMEEPPKPHAD